MKGETSNITQSHINKHLKKVTKTKSGGRQALEPREGAVQSSSLGASSYLVVC